MAQQEWGLYYYHVIVDTKLPPSPVILLIELGGKSKWLPLNFGHHDVMRTVSLRIDFFFFFCQYIFYKDGQIAKGMTFCFFVSRPNFLGNQCERAKKTNKPPKKKKRNELLLSMNIQGGGHSPATKRKWKMCKKKKVAQQKRRGKRRTRRRLLE